MAKLALDLSRFQSAGVYTVEIDQSERIVVTTQSLRLLPGFSKTGPFNSPVFIRSSRDRRRFFGERDSKLERKGSFFHRSIDTCLQETPVFAINLLNVNEAQEDASIDTAQAVGLSVDVSANNEDVIDDKWVNFFDRKRFWEPETENLQGVLMNKYNISSEENAPLLQFANIGTNKISFLVRKATDVGGFDDYAKDWYGSEDNIPYEWIRPYDKIADYFIEVIAIKGDWTKYNELANDPAFSNYFTNEGIKPSMLNSFINEANVTLIGAWTGTIIPDFRDQTGSNQYIETIVNGSTPTTGILLNVNKEALDDLYWDENEWSTDYKVDLVGHGLIDTAVIDNSTNEIDLSTNVSAKFLSYDIDVSAYEFFENIDISINDSQGKQFVIDSSADEDRVSVGTLIKKDDSGDKIPGVTYVVEKLYDGNKYIFETAEPIYDWESDPSSVLIQKPLDDEIVDHYKFIMTEGLTISHRHMPGYNEDGARSNEDGVEKVYKMIEDPGIIRGLTNPDMIRYRYIVDTMAYGLRPMLGGKSYLSRLAKKRGKTTALINFPSFRQLAASQDPYFTDTFVPGVDPTPTFNTKWIPQGGNPNMPRSFRLTLPDEANGGKYCGVFGPFLRYTENGKTTNVPPAADVSNTYIRKFTGGDPYAIVANQNGIISNASIAGLEYNVDQTDRDYLEPYGFNSIIERPNRGQILIYANRTSYQNVKSDYNYLHVRELLNTIELQVTEVLENYTFEYNNAVTRLNIVNAITPILQSVQDAGALADYSVRMDESNNTPEIIDEGFGVVDIGVWINKGMEKIVNRITLNRLGGVSSGGFSTV